MSAGHGHDHHPHDDPTLDDLSPEMGLSPAADPSNLTLRTTQPIGTVDRNILVNRDLLRCLRIGGVSGTYEGAMTSPTAGAEDLVLRVDIDSRGTFSPVLDRLSGDFYTVRSLNWGGRVYRWRSYASSWIVDSPQVTWAPCQVRVTGRIRYWKAGNRFTSVEVTIPWSGGKMAGPAQVVFRDILRKRVIKEFNCPRSSNAFRQLRLEVDVCASVNTEPVLPTYNTHAHNTRPGGLVQRNMTVASAFNEAGVEVTVAPERTIIDDSASQFSTWSNAELHDAMETHFSQYSAGGAWPKWDMWGILCGRHDNSGLAGIMFDWSATNQPPERQGFAIFRNHWWFNNVPAGAPSTQAQAEALRNYLYTWVHEAGHGFNFVHSWNKDRPNALSWMNYPQYVTNFWNNFMLEFDEEELVHLRHGDRASVIPGGDAWATGMHLEGGDATAAMAPVEGELPLELMVRSKGHFEFLEQVEVELRLRNVAGFPIEVASKLRPEAGTASIHIVDPHGHLHHYEPLICELGPVATRTLEPLGAEPGADRYSQNVPLTFGKHGFCFQEPGEYLVRAAYHDLTGVTVPSQVHRIRVGHPASREQDRFAADALERSVGVATYLEGSSSPFLNTAMDTLREMADRFQDSMVGVQAALTVGKAESRSHFRFDDAVRPVLKESHAPDPEEALKVTAPAVKLLKGLKEKSANLLHHEVVKERAEALTALGRAGEARKELTDLRKVLASRGVNATVLNAVEAFGKSLK